MKCQVNEARKTYQYEQERTSNPLCLVTSGVGGFDSTQSPQQLNYFEAKLVETGGVAWLMAA